MSPKAAEILIVGLSARALSASARAAGYTPLAADLFGDLDLAETADEHVRIDGDLERGLKWAPMIAALDAVSKGRKPAGVVCGTGFEDRPQLLDGLAGRWQILGNDAAAVVRAKSPQSLAELCGALGIPHPRWASAQPDGGGWVRKHEGGAGGAHVAAAPRATERTYWQECVGGEPVSALVLGVGDRALVLGFSAQWTDPLPDAPFRYGGAVRPAPLATDVEAELAAAATAIIAEGKWVGLNSVDFLVTATGWHLIEVNPRPGATLDIFQTESGSLFEVHMQACRRHLPPAPPDYSGAAAARIVYARRTIPSVPVVAWPEWTADRQRPGTSVEAGAPVCTVLASAADPLTARRLVAERGEAILSALEAGR